MATVSDSVASALKRIGVLGAGETADSDDSADALTALNTFLDGCKAERLLIPFIQRTTWTITANDGEYSVGSGGDINIDRPVFINEVRYNETSGSPDSEYPLIKLTDDGYASWTQKAATATNPSHWYYRPTYASSRGTLLLLPVPTSSTLEGVIYYGSPIATFTALSDTVTVPQGYQRFLETNLALELCPFYGKEPSPLLVQQARESKAVVKSANIPMMDMGMDAAVLGGRRAYDINLG